MRTEMGKSKNSKVAVQANTAHGLSDLFKVGSKDVYWAEKVLTKTLPKMIKTHHHLN